jgi:hypothetical protein
MPRHDYALAFRQQCTLSCGIYLSYGPQGYVITYRQRFQGVALVGSDSQPTVPEFGGSSSRNVKAQGHSFTNICLSCREFRDLGDQLLLNIRRLLDVDMNDLAVVPEIEASIVTVEAATLHDVPPRP